MVIRKSILGLFSDIKFSSLSSDQKVAIAMNKSNLQQKLRSRRKLIRSFEDN